MSSSISEPVDATTGLVGRESASGVVCPSAVTFGAPSPVMYRRSEATGPGTT
ncbi:hypothetical protein [Martelella alba]|uniref:hypothetical protein n=1 Tax=Martelella alba TaxID=2590451 RepID=UPI0015E83E78|nr:hypothetical protein [Martelella alba]